MVFANFGPSSWQHQDIYLLADMVLWVLGPVTTLLVLCLPPLRRFARFVFGIWVGMAVVLSFMLLFSGRHLDDDTGFAVAFVSVLGLLLNSVTALFLLLIKGSSSATKRGRMGLVWGIVGPAAVILIWSLVNPIIVIGRANRTAAGETYCLFLADRTGGSDRMRTPLQLFGLIMQAPHIDGGGFEQPQEFHALLIVERDDTREFYNWSYWSQAFEPLDPEPVDRRMTCDVPWLGI